MALTDLADITNQVQKFWAPVFTKEMRQKMLLGSLVNKDYEGEIKKGGDTVYVSQVNAPTGETLTIGTDADTFQSQPISTDRVTIQANKRFVAAYEVEDVASLQSQLDIEGSPLRESLIYAVNKQVDDYLKSLINPSSSAPDHLIASVTDFTATQLAAVRKLAATAKWDRSKQWYGLLDPSYYSDLIDESINTRDYGVNDKTFVDGVIGEKRMGFNIFEDDGLATDNGIFFHPDFLHLVLQPQVNVKISDLHAQKKFGLLMSVDIIGGAALGCDGTVKHIKVYNS